MQRWRTSEPLRLPIDFATVKRLDLELEDVRRDAGTFTCYVFVNPEGEVAAEAGRDHPSFAGSFTVFAHGRCWGEEGHCDYRRGAVHAFDRRPPHHLLPINVSMDLSDQLERLGDPDALDVVIHATRLSEPDAADGVLRFGRLTALAYQ
jgi:hypothetical protein